MKKIISLIMVLALFCMVLSPLVGAFQAEVSNFDCIFYSGGSFSKTGVLDDLVLAVTYTDATASNPSFRNIDNAKVTFETNPFYFSIEFTDEVETDDEGNPVGDTDGYVYLRKSFVDGKLSALKRLATDVRYSTITFQDIQWYRVYVPDFNAKYEWKEFIEPENTNLFTWGSSDSIEFTDRAMFIKYKSIKSGHIVFDITHPTSNVGQSLSVSAVWLEGKGITDPYFESYKPLKAVKSGDYYIINPEHFSTIGVHQEATGITDGRLLADSGARHIWTNQSTTDANENNDGKWQSFTEDITEITRVDLPISGYGGVRVVIQWDSNQTLIPGATASRTCGSPSLNWYRFNMPDTPIDSGTAYRMHVTKTSTMTQLYYSTSDVYANGRYIASATSDMGFKLEGARELHQDCVWRSAGAATETNIFNLTSPYTYNGSAMVKVPLSSSVTGITAVANCTDWGQTYSVVTSLDSVVNGTYWFDSANNFVYVGVNNIVNGHQVNISVNGTYSGIFNLEFPLYREVGDYIWGCGNIKGSNGVGLDNVTTYTTVKKDGITHIGPIERVSEKGNYDIVFSTNTLPAGIYTIEVNFTDTTTGIVLSSGSTLYLSTDPGSGIYVASKLYFNFYNNNTGFGIPIENLKVYADDELPLTSDDRLYAGILNTFTGETVYYNVTDYFGNIIYPNWDTSTADSDWRYYRTITIDHTKIDADLINFPILVSIPDATADKCDGGDSIRFFNTDNVTEYNYEIEDWTDGSDRIVWVNVTRIYSAIDTVFLMYYNNSNVSDNQNPTDVWDTNYKMVLHMNSSSVKETDVTSNPNDGVYSGTPVSATGVAGPCLDFEKDDAGDFLNCGTDSSLDRSTDITVEAWIKREAPLATVGLFRKDHCIIGPISDTGVAGFYHSTPVTRRHYSTSLATYKANTWDYIVMWADGTDNRFWQNTTMYDPGEANTDDGSDADNLYVGTSGTSYYDGLIDEFRISDIARNDSWLKATYHSIITAGFLTLGSEVTQATTYTVTPATNTSVTITSKEQWIDVPIEWNSFSVKNMNHSIVHFKMTNGSTTYSQYLYPYEPFYWDVLDGEYTINLTYYNAVTDVIEDYFQENITITSDRYYWIRGYDLRDIIIEIQFTNTSVGSVDLSITTKISAQNTNITNLNVNLNSNIALLESNVTQINNNIWNTLNITKSTITDQLNNNIWNSINISDTALKVLNNDIWNAINITDSVVDSINTNIWNRFIAQGVNINNTRVTINSNIELLESNITSINHNIWSTVNTTNTNIGEMKVNINNNIQLLETNITSLEQSINSNIVLFETNITSLTSCINNNINISESNLTQLNNLIWNSINISDAAIDAFNSSITNNIELFESNLTSITQSVNTNIALTETNVTSITQSINTNIGLFETNISSLSSSINSHISLVQSNITGDLNNNIWNAINVTDSVVDSINTNIWNRFIAMHSELNETHINVNNNIELLETNITSLTSSINSHLTVTESNITSLSTSINSNIVLMESNITTLNNQIKNVIDIQNSTMNYINNSIWTQLNLIETDISYITTNLTVDYTLINSSIDSMEANVNSHITLFESNISSLSSSINNHISLVQSNLTGVLNNNIWNSINITDSAVNNINTNIWNRFIAMHSDLNNTHININNNIQLLETNITSLTSSINSHLTVTESNITSFTQNINNHITISESNITQLNNLLWNSINVTQSVVNAFNNSITSNIELFESNITSLSQSINTNINVFESNITSITASVNSNIGLFETNITTLSMSINSNIGLTESNITQLNNNIWNYLNLTNATVKYLNNTIWNKITAIDVTVDYLNNTIWSEFTLINSTVNTQTNTIVVEIKNMGTYGTTYRNVPNGISHWTFDEINSTVIPGSYIYNDYIGENHGVLTGAWQEGGIMGRAAYFDGNDYIDCGTSPSHNDTNFTTNFTLSAWFYIETLDMVDAFPVIIARNSSVDGNMDGYEIQFYNASNLLRFRMYNNGTVVESVTWTDFGINAKTWYHIAVSVSDRNCYLYLNGTLDKSSALSSPYEAGGNNESLFIGARSAISGEWQGRIDDVRIYDVGLSSDDIEFIYNGTAQRISSWINQQYNTINIEISNINTAIGNVETNLNTQIHIVETNITGQLNTNIWNAINVTDSVVDTINTNIWNRFIAHGSYLNNTRININNNIQLLESNVTSLTSSINSHVTLTESNITAFTHNINNHINLSRSNITQLNNQIWNSINLSNAAIDNFNNSITSNIELFESNITSLTQNVNTNIVLFESNVTDITQSINTNIGLFESNITSISSSINSHIILTESNLTTLNNFISHITQIQNSTLNYVNNTIWAKLNLIDANVSSITTDVKINYDVINSSIDTMNADINSNIQFFESNITSISQSVNTNVALSESNITSLSQSINSNIVLSQSNITQLNNDIWNTINITDSVVDNLNNNVWNRFNIISNNITKINQSINYVNKTVWNNFTVINEEVTDFSLSIHTMVDLSEANLTSLNLNVWNEINATDTVIDSINTNIWNRFITQGSYINNTKINLNNNIQLLETNVTSLTSSINSHVTIMESNVTSITQSINNNINLSQSNITQLNNLLWNSINLTNTAVDDFNSLMVSNIELFESNITSLSQSINSNLVLTESNITTFVVDINSHINLFESNVTTLHTTTTNAITASRTNITEITNNMLNLINITSSDIGLLNSDINSNIQLLETNVSDITQSINTNLNIFEGNITDITQSINTNIGISEANVTSLTSSINAHMTITESNITALNNFLKSIIQIQNSTLNYVNETFWMQLQLIETNLSYITTNITIDYDLINTSIITMNSDINSNIALSETNLTTLHTTTQTSITASKSNITEITNNILSIMNLTQSNIGEFHSDINSNIILLESNITDITQSINTNIGIFESNITDITQSINTNIAISESNITSIASSVNAHLTVTESNLTTLSNFIKHITQVQNSTLNYVNSTIWTKLEIIETDLSYITTNVTVNYDLINTSLDTLNANVNSNIQLFETNITSLTTSINTNIILTESNITTLNNAIWDSLNITDSIVDNINNNIWSNLTAIDVTVDTINNNIDMSLSTVNSNLNTINTNIRSDISLSESNITSLNNQIWNSINLTDVVVDYINNSVWNSFTSIESLVKNINATIVNSTLTVNLTKVLVNLSLLSSNLNMVNVSIGSMINVSIGNMSNVIIQMWDSQNESFTQLENRSTVMFSFYNTNNGLGIPWEALQIYINDTRLTDYRYQCTNGTWLRLNVTDYYGNEMLVYNLNVSAPFTSISLGLTMHSWLFGNMNEDYYMISILKSGASRWWERGIVPYGEREFLIPSGTYCLRIYDRDNVEIYNSTLPASLSVINSKVYVIFGTNLSEIISGQSVIKGDLLELQNDLDDATRPDIVKVCYNLPSVYSTYDRSGQILGTILVCPAIVVMAETTNFTYLRSENTPLTSHALVPGSDSTNGTITIRRDFLYFSANSSTTFINVAYGGNETNYTYAPNPIELYGENVTVICDGNVSMTRITEYQAADEFDWTKWTATEFYEATVDITNPFGVATNLNDTIRHIYVYMEFANDTTPDYDTVKFYDVTNGVYLTRGKNYDVSASGVHWHLDSIAGNTTFSYKTSYTAEEGEVATSSAIKVIHAYTTNTLNDDPYWFFKAQWTNKKSSSFLGPLDIQFNFTTPKPIARPSIRIYDADNTRWLKADEFSFHGGGITIIQDVIGIVAPNHVRNFEVYFLYQDVSNGGGDKEEEEFISTGLNPLKAKLIGDWPLGYILAAVLAIIGAIIQVSSKTKTFVRGKPIPQLRVYTTISWLVAIVIFAVTYAGV